MKLVIAAVLGVTTLLGGGVAYNKATASSTTPALSSEVITLPSPQVALAANNSPAAKSANTKSVLKQNVDKKRVLYLNSEVNSESITPLVNKIKELNKQSAEPIYLLINSPGGEVLTGATLISTMETSKAPVYTVCTALCASMGAMIHSYGAKRYGLDRSILMYHPATAGVSGQVPNMLSRLNTINRYIDKMVASLVGKSKFSQEQFDKLVAYELWIDAEDATNHGFNDGIISLNVPNQEDEKKVFTQKKESAEPGDIYDFKWISPYPHLWSNQ